MTVLLAMLTASAAPIERGQVSTPQPAPLPRKILPPIRVDHRVILRPDTQMTILTELGVQPLRSERFALDVNIGGAFANGLRLPGQQLWRTMITFTAGADLLWEPNAWLSIGPSFNVDMRVFRQQFTDIGTTFTPNAGLRANIHMLRGRWWSVCLTMKPMVDLTRTDLVLDTAAVVQLSPYTMQAGIRLNFGHGRYREGT